MPKVPDVFRPIVKSEALVAHTSSYLPTLSKMLGSSEVNSEFDGSFAVIGGGQSSAEVSNFC